MKKNLLLFALLVFFATHIKAQTSVYYQFPDSNALWNETVTWYNDTCDGNEFYALTISGDTTINSNLYQKLSETGYTYSSICDTIIYFTNLYVAAIRQNTSLMEVYIVPKGDTSEMLLYDFNLSLGDTLPATYLGAANYNYVISVDSVLIGSNYRKSFGISVLDSGFDYMTLIEGIGSTSGLIAPVAPQGEYYYLLNCFAQNGQTIYPDTGTACTTPTTGIRELSSENFISLYPNPANNQLTILAASLHGDKPANALITNVLGQTLYQSSITNPQSEIDISFLSSGIYFFEMKWENGVTVKKFIKE